MSFFDNLSVWIWVIIITAIMVVCMFILSAINSGFQTSGITPVATTQLNSFTNKYNGIADGSIVLWLIILWIGTIVTSLFLDNYPVFFVIFTILSVISFFILAPLANVIVGFISDAAFSAVLAQLPLTSFILNHLLVFNALFIASTSLVLYAKFKSR